MAHGWRTAAQQLKHATYEQHLQLVHDLGQSGQLRTWLGHMCDCDSAQGVLTVCELLADSAAGRKALILNRGCYQLIQCTLHWWKQPGHAREDSPTGTTQSSNSSSEEHDGYTSSSDSNSSAVCSEQPGHSEGPSASKRPRLSADAVTSQTQGQGQPAPEAEHTTQNGDRPLTHNLPPASCRSRAQWHSSKVISRCLAVLAQLVLDSGSGPALGALLTQPGTHNQILPSTSAAAARLTSVPGQHMQPDLLRPMSTGAGPAHPAPEDPLSPQQMLTELQQVLKHRLPAHPSHPYSSLLLLRVSLELQHLNTQLCGAPGVPAPAERQPGVPSSAASPSAAPCGQQSVNFHDLLHPLTLAQFLSQHWEQQPLLLSAPAKQNLGHQRSNLGHQGSAQWVHRLLPPGSVTGLLQRGRALPATDAAATDSLQVLCGWRESGGARLAEPLRYGSDVRLVRSALSTAPQTSGMCGTTAADSQQCVAATEEGTCATPGDNLTQAAAAAIATACQVAVTQHYKSAGEPVSFGDCQRAFQDGYTLAISRLGSRLSSVQYLDHSLQSSLGVSPGTNLYLTPPGAQGLGAHYDDHCVWVIQLFGTKHWLVASPSSEDAQLPCSYHTASMTLPPLDRSSPGVQCFTLTPGDVLYIPRGWGHQAYTDPSPPPATGTQLMALGPDNMHAQERRVHTHAAADRWWQVPGASLHLTLGAEVEPCLTWQAVLHAAVEHVALRTHIKLQETMPRRTGAEGLEPADGSSSGDNRQAGVVAGCQLLLHVALCCAACDLVALRALCPLAKPLRSLQDLLVPCQATPHPQHQATQVTRHHHHWATPVRPPEQQCAACWDRATAAQNLMLTALQHAGLAPRHQPSLSSSSPGPCALPASTANAAENQTARSMGQLAHMLLPVLQEPQGRSDPGPVDNDTPGSLASGDSHPQHSVRCQRLLEYWYERVAVDGDAERVLYTVQQVACGGAQSSLLLQAAEVMLQSMLQALVGCAGASGESPAGPDLQAVYDKAWEASAGRTEALLRCRAELNQALCDLHGCLFMLPTQPVPKPE